MAHSVGTQSLLSGARNAVQLDYLPGLCVMLKRLLLGQGNSCPAIRHFNSLDTQTILQ